jgi:hypothetical protein
VLVHAFPDADIPVVQLSITLQKPLDWHVELGAKLAPLIVREIGGGVREVDGRTPQRVLPRQECFQAAGRHRVGALFERLTETSGSEDGGVALRAHRLLLQDVVEHAIGKAAGIVSDFTGGQFLLHALDNIRADVRRGPRGLLRFGQQLGIRRNLYRVARRRGPADARLAGTIVRANLLSLFRRSRVDSGAISFDLHLMLQAVP